MAKADIQADIDLDSSGFRKGLQKSKAGVKRFSDSAIGMFARVGAAFAGIGLVKSIVSLGTAAAETASKFKAVFGPAAADMNDKVKELRKTIPSTTAEMQDALATFAAMAKAFGLNTKAAGMFSVEMVKIAGDIASFHNLPIEEAFTKIRSAISGEFEPMKQLGIVINEARIKQEGLNIGINEGTKQLSAAQKALIVQSILIKDLGDANGDAAATADSAANRIKFLQKELIETGTTIGVTALPAILSLTEGLAEMLKLTKQAADLVGTKVGEAIFGVTDETLAKREKAISQYQAEKQAIKELTEQGKLYKQGLFEGTLWTKGLSEKLEENKRLIEERKNEILKASVVEEVAADKKTKADEEAIKKSKDTQAELEKQIKLEKDPERKKALEDRLKVYKQILAAVGDLNSMTPPSLGGAGGAASAAGAPSAVEGGGTGRNKISTGQIRTIGSGTRQSRFGPAPTFEERERAAGLYLRGGDPMSGRGDAGGVTANDKQDIAKKDKTTGIEEQTKSLTEIKEILTKLDNALQ